MELAPLCGGTHIHITINLSTFKNSEGVQHCFCIIVTGYDLDSLRLLIDSKVFSSASLLGFSLSIGLFPTFLLFF